MNKSNVACNYVEDMDVTFITFDSSICELQLTDQLTIEIDKGDSLADIPIQDIDTAELAKQGENPEATLTAIYKLLTGSEPDTPEIIPEGVAERLALILEFFGIKPIQAYEFMTAEEVCYELEEIMTTMDINLTPEKAKEITQQTLNN